MIGVPEPNPEDTFFALVLLDADFAAWFRSSRPNHAGFDRCCERFAAGLAHEQRQAWDEFTATAPTAADRRADPAMARAIDREVASFALVCRARYASLFAGDPAARARYRRFYQPVLEAFERQNGYVIADYWCDNITAAMVRTESRRQLHLVVNDFPDEALPISDRGEEVFHSVVEYLDGKERDLLAQDAWSVLTGLYADIDEAAAHGKPPKLSREALAKHQRRLDDTSKQADERIERRAQRWYVFGTFLGVLILSAALGVLAAFASGNWQRLFEGAVFGAAGALASVLFRMNRRTLRLNPRQGATLVAIAALVRPLTGAIFGAITTAVLLSSILPIEVTADEPERFYYLGTFAFIAGFAERWAPSLLQLAGAQAGTGVKQEAHPA